MRNKIRVRTVVVLPLASPTGGVLAELWAREAKPVRSAPQNPCTHPIVTPYRRPAGGLEINPTFSKAFLGAAARDRRRTFALYNIRRPPDGFLQP